MAEDLDILQEAENIMPIASTRSHTHTSEESVGAKFYVRGSAHASLPGAAIEETSLPLKGDQQMFLENFIHAMKSELRIALRAELPMALEQELPRALGSTCIQQPKGVNNLGGSGSIPPGISNSLHAPGAESLHFPKNQHDAQHDKGAQGGSKQLRMVMPFRESYTSVGGKSVNTVSVAVTESVDMVGYKDFAKESRKSEIVEEVHHARDVLDLRAKRLQRKLNQGRRIYSFGSVQEKEARGTVVQHLHTSSIRVVDTGYFVYFTTGLILTNSLFMGFQTNYTALTLEKTNPISITVIDLVFCFLFTLELGIRIFAQRLEFFRHDWKWNMFDCLLVGLQIIDIIIESATSNDDVTPSATLRLMRILRLTRILRMIRVVRYISELRSIISSIVHSFRSLAFTMLVIAILVYVVGIIVTQFVTEYRQDSENEAAKDELDALFGSLPVACLVMFQMMTGGIDWGEAEAPLRNYISPLMTPFLVAYIAFCLFALLNVVTGVFVETSLAVDAVEKEEHIVSRLRRFLQADVDKSGMLSANTLKSRLFDPRHQAFLQNVNVEPQDAMDLFNVIANRSGQAAVDDFVLGFVRFNGVAKAVDVATIMYDTRHHFHIVEHQLRAIVDAIHRPDSVQHQTSSYHHD